MRALATVALTWLGGVVAGMTPAWAQEWATGGSDAQRSSWVRTDPKISPAGIRKPGFQFLWKLQVTEESTKAQAVTPPVLLDLVIGYRGFRALGFVGAGADHLVALDTDLGRMEWERRFARAAPAHGAPPCVALLPPQLARPTNPAFPTVVAGYGGGASGGPARGAVGEPGEGAVTLRSAAPQHIDAGPAPPTPSGPRPRPRPFPVVYALSSDGVLHTLNVVNGADAEPPTPFLPPDAAARGLMVVDDVAYVATVRGCGEAPSGVWALDLGSKQVATWRSPAGIVGSVGLAMGPDGTIYVAASDGELRSLEPRTLTPKRAHRSGGPAFASSPLIFEHLGRLLIAASSRDGRIRLLDSDRSSFVQTPVFSRSTAAASGGLASWVDSDGTRWLVTATAGPVGTAPGYAGSNGTVTHGAIVAWRVVDQAGVPTLQPGWVSHDLATPLTPAIVNGVVFVVSGGERRATRARRPDAAAVSPAILYALDGATGRELWSSAATMTSVESGGLSAGAGQVYVTTATGTLYAFGFPMEH
jgi:outer membrane protein assembly factor BamB